MLIFLLFIQNAKHSWRQVNNIRYFAREYPWRPNIRQGHQIFRISTNQQEMKIDVIPNKCWAASACETVFKLKISFCYIAFKSLNLLVMEIGDHIC